MWGASGDKDSVALTLGIGVAHHAIVFKQALTQPPVQVDGLVVDRIIVRLQLLALLQRHLVQEVADFVGVARMKNVP